MTYRYIPFENHANGSRPRPVEMLSGCGPWLCSATEFDPYTGEPGDHLEFLEVHLSSRGDGVVFRVSEWSLKNRKKDTGDIRLGQCAILDRNDLKKVRDHINDLLEQMKDET